MDSEGREPEMPVDQQVIENDVNRVGGHVGAHGDLRIAGTSLRGVNPHLNTVKDHAAHDNLEIRHCAVMGFRCGTAQVDDRTCQNYEKNT